MKGSPGVSLLARSLLVTTLLTASDLPLLAQSDTNDNYVLELPLVESPPQVGGTFWLLSDYFYDTNGFLRFSRPPRPVIPLADQGLPVYYLTPNTNLGLLSTNSYVIDDSSVLTENSRYESMTEDDSSGDSGGSDFSPAYSYPSNYLYLIIDAVSNSTAFVRAIGTVPGQIYELLSRESLVTSNSLAATNWTSESTFIGAENQDWTPTTVPVGTRTNQLWITCRSWVDQDGDGLPDWWEMQYGLDPNNPDTGNTGIPDGYKDLSGSGRPVLYYYQNGLDPRQPTTPPPPQNVQARLDSTGTNVILSWESGGGPVSSYGIERGSTEVGATNNTSFAFLDRPGVWFVGSISDSPAYRIRAYFSDGSHADSSPVQVTKPEFKLTASFGRGPSGLAYLAVQSPPPNLFLLRLYWYPGWSPGQSTNGAWIDIYATNLLNGIAQIPSRAIIDEAIDIQAFGTNGDFGQKLSLSDYHYNEDYAMPVVTNFLNASAHLKADLMFLLRSATTTLPFTYDSDQHAFPFGWDDWDYPEQWYRRIASPTNYEYYGFRMFSPGLNYSSMNPTRSLGENFLWRNFLFDSSDFVAGWFVTGAQMAAQDLRGVFDPLFLYTGNGTESPLPLAFSHTNALWTFYNSQDADSPFGYDPHTLSEMGLYTNGSGSLVLGTSAKNCYGLPISSIKVANNDTFNGTTTIATLNPGVPSSYTPLSREDFFPGVDFPGLQIVDYYFASQTPYFRFYTNVVWYGPNFPAPALPGSPNFWVTNSSPLLIAPWGQEFVVSGWAKMAITNGDSDKYAYLEQYWDNAYKIGTNGLVTTNQTGLLSPYGEFFPTEPGPAALVTLPDIDTGQRGTGVVNVIKLQLDVNHDGVMDLTFGGPDNTSQDRPFVFWVNNDCDWATSPGYPNFDPGSDRILTAADSDRFLKDYLTAAPRSIRDLEDWARLWICGLPALASGNFQVTLNWQNVSGSPAINLIRSAETNGGTLYLIDTNTSSVDGTAWRQISTDFGLKYAVSTGGILTLPGNWFTNAGNKYFLFEGAGIGKGELVLTVTQGTNMIAKTSTWLDLHDVADLFEHAHAQNVTTRTPPSSLVSQMVRDTVPTANFSESKQVIVFIHGINNTPEEAESTSSTLFKRLYWAGYHGRFATFRWPCGFLPPRDLSLFGYDVSEFYAFKSAGAFKDYLTFLRNNTNGLPGYSINILAHSQGNVVASEALQQGAPFDNYILTQGAFPAHCYDTSTNDVPFLQKLLDAEIDQGPTPLLAANGGYHGYLTNLAGNLINFYNTNDFALASGTTAGLQTNWEENQRIRKPETLSSSTHFYVYYTATQTSVDYLNSASNIVTDLHETKSMVARSRSHAVGAQAGMHGVINNGASVDLKATFQFGASRPDHSAQFTRTIQIVLPYYRQVLSSFEIFP